ncbi:MAG: substrate-binding domain-containing protein [Alphaproteobacteria bacterium]|nr:substrate-binding domain-containing protein [Alphaproteobacteria bacterium]
MTRTKTAAVAALATLALAVIDATKTLRAAEIRLLSAASMQTVFREVVGDFERASGHKVIIDYRTMGGITERVLGGEQADLVLSSPQSIARLVQEARLDAASVSTIARTGVGIIVPDGDAVPPIEAIEDFARALRAAKTIVYANPAGGGAAGIHIARLIEKLGLTEQLKAKTQLAAGGDVTEVTLAQGAGALGMTQVSEIVGKPGARLVAMPEALQNYTGFTIATPSGAPPNAAVAAFVAFLKSPAAVATMKAKGMRVDGS